MSTKGQEAMSVRKPDAAQDRDGICSLPEYATFADDSLFSRGRPDAEQQGHKHNHSLPQPGPTYCSYQPSRSLLPGYGQPTPFPSQAEPSFGSSWSGYPNSLPSYVSRKDCSGCPGDGCRSGYKFLSLPGGHSTSTGSLEQPFSLRSNPPSVDFYHHTLSPYACSPQGAACCAQCPPDTFNRGPMVNHPGPQLHPAYSPCCESGDEFIDPDNKLC